MLSKLDRRQFLTASAAVGAVAAMPSWSWGQDLRLRMAWWGGQDRADLTLKALELYKQQNAGLTIDSEYLGWGDYWSRVSTQAAGGNAPDVIQMDIEYLAEYASRGVLLDLSPYVGNQLKIGDFDQAVVDNGTVDGKLYAVSAGINAGAIVYNAAAYEEAGVTPPSHDTTWEDFAVLAAEFTKKTSRTGMFGSTDESGAEPVLETWLRQRGKQLYGAERTLGYDEADLTEWFQMWVDMRASGAIPPAEVQALDQGNIDSSLIAQSRAALVFANSNQFLAYKSLTPDKLGLAPYPKVGAEGKGGLYIKPSQFFSVSARTANPEAAVTLIDFLLTDPGATAILGGERGLPSSAAARETLRATVDDDGKVMIDYISNLGDLAGALPPPNPPGGGELTDALAKASQEVSFGVASPADSAAKYVAFATELLAGA